MHQTDQLAHNRDETELRWFAVGFESLVKSGEDWVAAHRAHRRHVEHRAHLPAACSHMARGMAFAGVSWVRCDSDQGWELRGFDLAQLGHIGQQRGRKHWADAFDLLQALRICRARPDRCREVVGSFFRPARSVFSGT